MGSLYLRLARKNVDRHRGAGAFLRAGHILDQTDQTVYWLSVQSMPFARPIFAEMVQALDFVIKNDYPARGEYSRGDQNSGSSECALLKAHSFH
jgi:hypothetical protein